MSRSIRPIWIECIFALAAGAGGASGQSVHIVAGDGSGDFLQLQQAVDAAANGDVILVRPHSVRYEPTSIDGKRLTIVGDGSVRPELKRVRISNLPNGSDTSLRFLDIQGAAEIQVPVGGVLNFDGLGLKNNAGCVWLEDLVVAGAHGVGSSGTDAGTGKRGLDASSNDCVVLIRSVVSGGNGSYTTGATRLDGGTAAQLDSTRIAIYGCTIRGGMGIDGINGNPGAHGGDGLESSGSTLFLSGSTIAGGDTGSGPLSATPTASGLVLIDGSAAQYLDSTFQAGAGSAPPGNVVSTSGSPSTLTDLSDDHRQLTLPAAMRELGSALVMYSGQPGDFVALFVSPVPTWLPLTPLKGVLNSGVVTSTLLLGFTNASGTLGLSFQVPMLPPSIDAATAYAQIIVAESSGLMRLAAPSSILILDSSFP